MGRGVILIRHAMPVVVPGLSSKLWHLSEASREDCVFLAHALPEELAPVILASDQPKAVETAKVVALRRGLVVTVDARFAEVDQGEQWIGDSYREVAAAYLGGADQPDWEPRHRVVARFEQGVEDALATSPEGDVVVVNHGLALSLWLASKVALDLVPFWRALTFPDAWRFELETGALERAFFGGVAPE